MKFQKKLKSTANSKFLELLERVKKKGISFKGVAEKIGVNKQKLINIRHGRSSADIDMVRSIFEHYPEIIEEGDDIDVFGAVPQKTEWEKKIEEQEEEIKRLKEQLDIKIEMMKARFYEELNDINKRLEKKQDK